MTENTTTNPDIYVPEKSRKLSDIKNKQQIRLGIQGFPGVGKTWAALTFPNPVVLNFDRGLGAHVGREDVIEIPFWDITVNGPRNTHKDTLVRWIESTGMKLTPSQTLIIDGLSSLEIIYHLWYSVNQVITSKGKVDDFSEWQIKKAYFGELFEITKGLRCDVILLAHEAEKADKPTTVGQPGVYTGKIRPLLGGASGDIITRDFTDWFRMFSADKPSDIKEWLTDEKKRMWGFKTVDEAKAAFNQFPGNTIYYWQTEGDDKFDAKRGSLVGCPRYLPATYNSFKQYMRKV